MGTFISIVGFILMGISIVLMLFGIGVAIVDTFWGLCQFDAIDGITFFLSGVMLLLLSLMIVGLSTTFMGGIK